MYLIVWVVALQELFGLAAEPCMDKEKLDGKGAVTVEE